MTVRDYRLNAENEYQRRRREAGDIGYEERYGAEVDPSIAEETEIQRLYRESPTADQLTPDLFLEDAGAIDAGESQAGQAEASLLSQYHTMGALDELIGQYQADQGPAPSMGQSAQMAVADSAYSGAARRAGDAADSRAMATGTSGSGTDVMGQVGALGGANDALLMNYTSVYNQGGDQAMDALSTLAREATGLRGQTFGESFRRGQAVDAFNAHNLGYMRDVNERNTDRQSRQSAEREAAIQQTEDNEYGLHQGTTAIRTAQGDIAEQERQNAKDETLIPFYATTGAIKSVLG